MADTREAERQKLVKKLLADVSNWPKEKLCDYAAEAYITRLSYMSTSELRLLAETLIKSTDER